MLPHGATMTASRHAVWIGCLILLASSGFCVADDAPAEKLQPFFSQYCNDCHGDGADEGGLQIDVLDVDLSDAASFERWQRVFDRVVNREMPPDGDEVDGQHYEAFRNLLGRSLHASHAKSKGTVMRRLNRREYQNTLNDLFGTNLDLESMLPEDGRSHEFDNVGESLSISMVQLQRYLDAIDSVMDAAIAKRVDAPVPTIKNANYADTVEGEKHIGSAWKQADDGAVVFFRPLGYPTGMLRTANVREAGKYRIAVTGYAYQSEVPITFAIGATTFQRGAERPTFAYHAVPPGEPTTIEIEAHVDRNYMIELTPWGIADRDNEIRKKGIESYTGPGLAIVNVELEGPLVDQFPSRGHHLLFDGLKRTEIEPRNPRDKQKSWYVPKFAIEASDDAINNVLHRVAAQAFRRPVNDADLARYRELFHEQRAAGADFESAMRTAVAAIFCSPDFLYMQERPGQLDEHALATRLAYFLTRTAPDEELRRLADQGKLSDHETLIAQSRRLRADARFDRFIDDFADAWLNLRDIEFTSPDKSLFPEFDPFLQFSMLAETREFLKTVIRENAPVTSLVKPNFAMLNVRLAHHYGIEGVSSPQVRKVDIPVSGVRGGLLGQASILKVSANGTNTSPVVRGVWVMERLMGQTPPPPPAGIAGVEPDIRGATTLRELLDKHRDLDSCRSCHAMIDPPGFALESFNPIGGWRERFRSLGQGDRVETLVAGRRVRYRLGPQVDASGEMANGERFDGFVDFRDRLASDDDRLARTLATKLLTFATGREMGFSDRPLIEKIVAKSKLNDHRIGDLIELVVSSTAFNHK